MNLFLKILIALIALQHFYFLWFEMFAWKSRGPKIFRKYDTHFFEQTKSLAGNQGLYNGFLAAGLVWSLLIHGTLWSSYIAIFFLSCVSIAGIYGSITASRKILYLQGIPAIITLVLLLIQLNQ